MESIPGSSFSRKEPSINNPHLTPIIITGGAALAAIIALSRAKYSKPTPVTANSPATKWTNETITSSFVAAIPEITSEINLELATATQTEVFTKTSSWILWGLFDLGTSTVQIRVPVTYRYHLRLREPWRLEVQGRRVVVYAPAFRPSQPPAIQTNNLEKLSVRGWCRGGTGTLMDQAQKEITPILMGYASDVRHLHLVRGQCRQSAAEFVKLWLERERQWGGNGLAEIQIIFPSEEDAPVLRRLP